MNYTLEQLRWQSFKLLKKKFDKGLTKDETAELVKITGKIHGLLDIK